MRRLDVSAAGVLPATVPKRFIKLLVGLFLLPAAWVLTQTFFMAFARTTIRNQFWITEEFWFFSLGVILWLVAFFGLPRPIWLYVFGHELTHAIWVMLMGGRVHRFQVTRQGGHILADRTNTWIALAPYFFPLYSLLAIIVYGICGIFWDVAPYRWILYMVIGVTWAFHLTFTVWMITKGQPDLYYGGTFFSLVVIYILNLILLSIMLVLAAPEITWLSFLRELFQNTVDFTADLTLLLNRAIR
ncbi:hypothetical protein TSACC_22951 [Terrimicrobium sacchariphilum]|uniref:Peptidase M50B-like n=1 Tax=Terrimicrobium sacchariphilum TaxID=690879 RepID=A0A146GDE6_TERSA|nr:hypothetical protein TSACC_22951 [Terrimicrobium sacchariphilum]